MNEILWLLEIVICFSLVVLAYKLFGKAGLWAWIPISVIVANIQVTKTVEFFGFAAALGHVVYSSSYLVTNLLTELYGKHEARKAVMMGFFTLLVMILLMNLTLVFLPISSDSHSLGVNKSMTDIFGLMPRIGLASIAAFLTSQLYDVSAFALWRKKFPSRKQLWIRNNLSTLASQMIDTVIFTLIAFYGTMPFNIVLQIIFTTYVLKGLLSFADTPFFYWAIKITPVGESNQSK